MRRGVLARICLLALALLALAALAPTLASAASTPKTALIDEESVTTNDGIVKGETPISLEQYAAEQAGFTVTVSSGASWEAMTPEEFAHYQLLIVGDPDCRSTALSAVNSAPRWVPVVMGAGANPLIGNRTVVGTDPEFHYASGGGGAQPKEAGNPSSAGAEHLVQDGIAFAGGRAEATGVYFDTSCSDLAESEAEEDIKPMHSGGLVQEEVEGPDGLDKTQVLDHLTTTGETWGEDTDPPCGGSVQQVAANPVFDEGPTKLLDSDIQGWGCSDHVTFPSFPADWFPLAVATDTASHPTCGNDPETHKEVCGEAYVLLAGVGIVAEAPNLSLEPKTNANEAGPTHTHTVTANVHKEENEIKKPLAGIVVKFVVTGQNAGVGGTCTAGGVADPECKTDENGNVQFTYTDTKGAGLDTIVASTTLETVEEEEVIGARPATTTTKVVKTTEQATATQEWTPVPVVTVKATPPAGKSEVLAFGSARLASSARGCVASTGYLASVSGKAIASVTFTLDGHKLKTLSKPNSHGKYTLRIKFAPGHKHHLSIHVTYTSASKTSPTTIHRTLARCAVAHHVTKPRFTG